MGTWIGCYVKDLPPDQVAELCRDWLERQRGRLARLFWRPVRRRRVPAKDAALRMGIMLPSRPTQALVFAGTGGWTTVCYDSFADPNPLAVALSAAAREPVVDTIGQTTSDAYSLRVYRRGVCVRHLAFAMDEGWLSNDGAALPGEPVPLESVSEDDGEPTGFTAEALDRYLSAVFGIRWWHGPDEGDEVWVVG